MTDVEFSRLRTLMDNACPIDWVSTPDRDQPAGWTIHFNAAATPTQKQAALAIIANFVPNPPAPQGELVWEDSEVPGALRLVALYNGKKTAIVGAVGADASQAAMYQSPGPVGPQPAGPRREFHVATEADIPNIPVPVMNGDTLYIEGNGEYRFSGGAWRRLLTGPALGSVADQVDLYANLNVALDAAINPQQGPQIDPRVKAVLIELRKLI